MAKFGHYLRFTVLAVAVILAMPSRSVANESSIEVRAARLWESPDATRVVVDLSNKVEYKTFTLDRPHRLVIDLQNAQLASDYRAPSMDGLIQSLRTGKPKVGTLRLVLDLTQAARVKTFLLEPAKNVGHRLVLDLFTNSQKLETPKQIAEVVGKNHRDIVIAIDAGHGGEDPGAHGPNGTNEKMITLAIAKKLAQRVNAQPGLKALLIRDGDYFVPLNRRYEKARKTKADLFISIHADAVANSAPKGSSVYVLSPRGASSEQARMLADIENQSDLVGGVSLDDKGDMLAAVLLDLSQGAAIGASENVAKKIILGLGEIGSLHKREVQRANFVVLRSPDVPSILVETAFISNPEEEQRLRDPSHQEKIAEAILTGVRQHFEAAPPPGTLLASLKAGVNKNTLDSTFAAYENDAVVVLAQQNREHVVRSGESLTVIAQRHRVSLSQLRKVNNIRGDVVRIGAKLKIPSSS